MRVGHQPLLKGAHWLLRYAHIHATAQHARLDCAGCPARTRFCGDCKGNLGARTPPTCARALSLALSLMHPSDEARAQAGEHAVAAKQELNLLASLISTNAAPAGPFKINLFPDSLDKPGGGARAETITVDFAGEKSAGRRRELDDLVSGMGEMSAAGNDADDDLLSLMDQAGSK